MQTLKTIALQGLIFLLLFLALDQILYFGLKHQFWRVRELRVEDVATQGRLELPSAKEKFYRFPCVRPTGPKSYLIWKATYCGYGKINGLWGPMPHQYCKREFRDASGKVLGQDIENFDELGRRVVPWKGVEKRHLFLMGTSGTYGKGVNDDQTIAAELGKLHPTIRPYLGAGLGGGPNDAFASLDRFMQFGSDTGLAVYVTYAQDAARFAGTALTVGIWSEYKAAVKEVAPGEFKVLGSWQDGRPVYTAFLKILGHSGFINYFNLDVPSVTKADMQSYARLFLALKKRYLAKFPKGRFVVVLAGETGHLVSALKPLFDDLGIEYLDHSRLCTSAFMGDEPATLGDSFTPAFFKAWAKILDEDLKIGSK